MQSSTLTKEEIKNAIKKFREEPHSRFDELVDNLRSKTKYRKLDIYMKKGSSWYQVSTHSEGNAMADTFPIKFTITAAPLSKKNEVVVVKKKDGPPSPINFRKRKEPEIVIDKREIRNAKRRERYRLKKEDEGIEKEPFDKKAYDLAYRAKNRDSVNERRRELYYQKKAKNNQK